MTLGNWNGLGHNLVKENVWLRAKSLNTSCVFKLSHFWACAPLCLINPRLACKQRLLSTTVWSLSRISERPADYKRRPGEPYYRGGKGGSHQFGTKLDQICWTCYLFALLWQSVTPIWCKANPKSSPCHKTALLTTSGRCLEYRWRFSTGLEVMVEGLMISESRICVQNLGLKFVPRILG